MFKFNQLSIVELKRLYILYDPPYSLKWQLAASIL